MVRKRRLTLFKEFYNRFSGVDLNEFLCRIAEIKEQAQKEGYSNLEIEACSEDNYGDRMDYLVVKGRREETDEEMQSRIKKEEAAEKEMKRRQLTQLKKELGED